MIEEYLSQKRELYDNFKEFIGNENYSEDSFHNYLKSKGYFDDVNEFRLILHQMSIVSNNIHHNSVFYERIKRFISSNEEFIKRSFSNSEIFNIFKENRLMLLFLFKKNIIVVDEFVSHYIITRSEENFSKYINYFSSPTQDEIQKSKTNPKKNKFKNYEYYFYPEIKPFISEWSISKIEKKLGSEISEEFEKNRQIGENESYICQLIRQDSIEDFIIYVSKNNLSLSMSIQPSIFETNPFLINKSPSLIEYAAFFGSIQIFIYLQMNKIELTPSLWLYSIHGNNSEILQILEDKKIKPKDDSFLKVFRESVKCHHNGISNYISNCLMNQENSITEKNFKDNCISYGFHYHNYEFLHNFENINFLLYYACLYGYLHIVKLLLENGKIDLNQSIIMYQTNYGI